MTAYVISEVEVLDEAVARRYRELAAASIAVHGGRYLVRGETPAAAEGNWPPVERLVIVEFPDMDRLRAWYVSSEYAPALVLRSKAIRRRLLFVSGVAEVAGGAVGG